MSKPLCLILAGGLSHERDVSLRSGRRVAEALSEAGCAVEITDLSTDLLPRLTHANPSRRPDIVWPLLHGASGEDGSIQGVLELLGYRYLGSAPGPCRAAWNKTVAKSVVAHAGLATPPFVTLPQSLFQELGAAALLDLVSTRFGLPVVVKPVHGGSALGVNLVTEASRLSQALMECFAYSSVALIERAVSGMELAVSVVDLGEGPFALPAVEIVTDGAYDYDARYNPGRAEFFAPARLSDTQVTAVGETATHAHQALGLVRLSRIDMILDPAGHLWFLEANVSPGMQETSLLPQAALAGNYPLPRLYRTLVEASIAND
ncbi:MAG: ATP-grasp domain-containing protein [Bifidobacteriaceae bacterium]|jgi:D-alanine-D-alanine ligase|nr:ATP-grasp domain-containing protein [Bifidobacteriaceae bacterium]